ncbi:MAG: trifunctional transcriptional regulator/proline dehydrogenase/L-glutamate gamma-semialdehyde [Pseudomonadota bacterium]|jgi:RHH-type proline utilization regulon transcriptional repressor/proline dehydrogenase/delta 1-pyrroline-5-carboxylate dehydrogenase
MSQSFNQFVDGPLQREPLRAAITAAWRRPDSEAVATLLGLARLPRAQADAAQALAQRIARQLRGRKSDGGRAGIVQGLLQEYALSSQEGVALMCLAEALLRIPDAATRDALIRDKITHGDWAPHLGHSPSPFVNAASWGLLITGKLVSTHSERGLGATLGGLIRKGGEPLIRKGVDMAMRMLGQQFVTGETIALALEHARGLEAQGFRYSYDMLGEAALTAEDAERYLASYEAAIHAIGQAAVGKGIYDGAGISIKLSALHPRYSRAQYARVMAELYPALLKLALLARQYDIGLNIDAEEADRLELSLDLLEQLCFEPGLQGFDGIGFVIQAYQKRCPFVIDYVIELARRSGHRLMIRLVKGAYWDSEIKRAQLDGQHGYPVYTRKAYTDISYLACARKLLAAPDAVYPQFATHNAHSLAAIYELAGPDAYHPGQYEFQCLHGMGEPLYEQVVGQTSEGKLGRPCRIYAPVGTHETLLAYLVRRLLENGANTSFVNRIADPGIAIETLVEDPGATVERWAAEEGALGLPHPAIAQPLALYGPVRVNSEGLDLSNETTLAALSQAVRRTCEQSWDVRPLLAFDSAASGPAEPVLNPANHADQVGTVRAASAEEVQLAVSHAQAFFPHWAATAPAERATLLERAAELMQAELQPLIGLLIREAGKTAANAIAEVREAIDFLRYYAAQVRADFRNDTHLPLGPVACISPWNFPLAIFTGQVAAALAAGNTVLAKPAEQTPIVAHYAVRLLRQAGVPRAAVQLVTGSGSRVGAQLVGDERVQGVMFTGSTEVARILQATLASRLSPAGKPVPLIAETGGQNCMVVDSSALTEQVVNDVVSSAFDSAGQRCSALRVLCVQEEVADRVIHMLEGAMAEQRLGRPDALNVDIGPVIDAEARDGIWRHIEAMRVKGRPVFQQARIDSGAIEQGTFIVPTLIELERIDELEREVFGPVLHLVRYRRRELGALIEQINATGYGLTFGVHSRIDETIDRATASVHAGNLYVNRNMVGAVVGVQPFGGEGLSGTGPKAGGPLYLYRLLAQQPADALARGVSFSGGAELPLARPALQALRAWAQAAHQAELAVACDRFAAQSRSGAIVVLCGPTGERNHYQILPREAVLGLARLDADRLVQLAATLAVGSRAIWPASAAALRESLPQAVREQIALADDWRSPAVHFDAVLHHGNAAELRDICDFLARRPGAIVGMQSLAEGEAGVALERLVLERSVSVNTAAAGGNASLMTLA